MAHDDSQDGLGLGRHCYTHRVITEDLGPGDEEALLDKFEWDDENKKNGNIQHLRDHEIEPWEAEECFFRDFVFARDEGHFDDIYVMEGKTDRGRRLRLVLQDKGKGLGRIITGWDLKARKKKKKK